MSDTGIPMDAERTAAPVPGQAGTAGAQLKARRLELGWSIEHVAEQLKLAPRQLLALEDNDSAALPTPAVVRGFVRATAKVLKLDPAPLVAMIDLEPVSKQIEEPVQQAILPTSSRSRFPSMTERSATRPLRWVAGGIIVAVIIVLIAYRLGYAPPAMLTHTVVATPAAVALETPVLKLVPEAAVKVLPLVLAATSAPDVPTAIPVAVAMPVALVVPAAKEGGANALILTARSDSWVEIRRKAGGAPLISRLLHAGTNTTFDITEPVLLIVGKPSAIDATLRGTVLPLTTVGNNTTSRLTVQ